MSSRSTRRTQANPALSSIEALLLAQAAWEFGAASANWSQIAKILSKHPLLSRPKSFFTAQSCHAMYEQLLKEADLELSDANYKSHAEGNLSLAQKHYRSRFEELKELIVAEESKFKAILKEIEDIQAGLLDTTIDEFRIEKQTFSEPRRKNQLHDEARIPGIPVLASHELASSPNHPSKGENNISYLEVRNYRPNSADNKCTSQIPDSGYAGLEKMPTARQDNENTGQRQEEEEEELDDDEENKEEEEETSQGQGELEVDQHEDAPASPKSAVFGMETDSDLPMDVVMGEKRISDMEEPVVQTRRSTRRRKSFTALTVSHPLARTRLRARGRVADESQTVDSDIDEKDNASMVDDERASSPFDPGTTRRRDSKRKVSLVDSVDSPQDRKRQREDSEPVEEEEPGPSVHNTRARAARNTTKTDEQIVFKRFQNVIGMLHSQISQHRNGTIFHHPIKPSEAPDYHDIVKRPMDLKTIKNKVRDGMISNSLEFQRDIYLMFANSMMYNRPGSDVYTMADDMMQESEAQMNTFRQTEGLLSARRGQR